MAQQPYPVIGVSDGSGIQPRLEIRDLEKRSIQFSLFIRALTKIQEMRSSDENSPNYLNKANSWWQIGSIHGLPFKPWSGDPLGPQNPNSDSEYQGYCYHASALFPTWHRVYLLLIEQAVVNAAIQIAEKLEDEDPAARGEQWVQAAKELRYPFWDWTKQDTAYEGIPYIFRYPKIQIVNPGGKNGPKIPNPLNHYRYAGEPGAAKGVEYMGNWIRTFRWVDSETNPTKERYYLALKAFSEETILRIYDRDIHLQPVSWLRDKVAGLFYYPLLLDDPSYGPNIWGYFSNTSAKRGDNRVYLPPGVPLLPSVEESHNMVHLDTGGVGSMSVNEYAAFDPIFHLHHCNVDRLYAFWEYVYPNYWIGNGWKNAQGEIVPFKTDVNGNFQQGPNQPVDRATNLIPYRTDGFEFPYWTSDEVRSLLKDDSNLRKKYYTYPAIEDPITGVKVKVDEPYNENPIHRELLRQALVNEWGPDLYDNLQTVQSLSANLHPKHSSLFLDVKAEIVRLRNFVLVVELPEFAFAGSYRLELLLLPKDSQQGAVHVVNSVSVLARANPEYCGACKDRLAAGSLIRGHMSLDPLVILHLISRLGAVELEQLDSVERLSALVSVSFGTRLVKPDGTLIATAGPNVIAKDEEVLEEAKAPELALHSQFISFTRIAHPDTETRKDPIPIVKLETPVYHGPFGAKKGWKAF